MNIYATHLILYYFCPENLSDIIAYTLKPHFVSEFIYASEIK